MRAANAGGQPNASASSASKRGQSPAIASCSSCAATRAASPPSKAGSRRPRVARCAAATMRPRCGASASKNKAACSIVAGVRSSSASASRRSPAASMRALARRASTAKREASIGARRLRASASATSISSRSTSRADQRGVEIGATRDGARLRRFAVGRRREPFARQRDRFGERDQRRLAAHGLDGGERVGRCGIGREPAREGRARRLVRLRRARRSPRRGRPGGAARRRAGRGGNRRRRATTIGGRRDAGWRPKRRETAGRSAKDPKPRFAFPSAAAKLPSD